jgi:transglutaminase-like putative cysteine protease
MISLKIGAVLEYVVDAQSELLFHLQPARTLQQAVWDEKLALAGAAAPTEHIDSVTGNRILRTRSAGGTLKLEYAATVTLSHFFADPGGVAELQVRDIPEEVLPYLLPSRYCESDRLSVFAKQTFGHLAPGYWRVQAVCDWVYGNVRFAPGASNPTTSALGTLEARAGVCRDFAHLAIALLRALNVPARFVSSYDYGADPAFGPTDFHAYVEAFLGNRWYIFDPTRICPRNGLVRIGCGFDAADVAFATIYGPTRFVGMALDIVALGMAGEPVVVNEDPSLAVSTSGMLDMHPYERPAALSVMDSGALSKGMQPAGVSG